MEIYRENGFLGYYAGVVPRIIANVSVLILASASTYMLNNYVVHEQTMKAYTASTMKVSKSQSYLAEYVNTNLYNVFPDYRLYTFYKISI